MFPGGTYLRGLWKQKPRAWGPASVVSSVLSDRLGCNILDVPYAMICWSPGEIMNYGYLNDRLSQRNTTFKRNSLYFPGTFSAYIDCSGEDVKNESISILVGVNTTSATKMIIAARDSYTASSRIFQFYIDDNGLVKFAPIYPTYDSALFGSTEVTDGKDHAIGFSFRANKDASIHIDGLEDYSENKTYALDSVSSVAMRIGQNNRSLNEFFIGYIPFFIYVKDGLSKAFVQDITANPYKLWQPPVFRTYFDLAESGITLVINNISQNQTLDSLYLIQQAILSINSIDQTHTIENPGVAQLQALITDSINQGQSTQALNLTQLHTLITNAVSQGQSVDAATIQLLTELVINSVYQTQSTQALTLTQLINLIITDVSQAQNVASVTLEQLHDLLIMNILQGQSAGNLALEIPGVLVIYDILQGQAVQSPTLAQKIALTLQDVMQGQSVESASLDQLHQLACDSINQGQNVDTAELEQLISLSVANVSQGQALDSPNLFNVFQLNIDDISQAQSMGTMNIDQVSSLLIDNVSQGNIIQAINFAVIQGKVTITFNIKTPGANFNVKTPGAGFSIN